MTNYMVEEIYEAVLEKISKELSCVNQENKLAVSYFKKKNICIF